jgi:hypothetical protein
MQEKRIQVACLILFGLTLLMFVDVLFSPREVLLAQQGTDLSAQFVYWREFGFGQLAQGNLALWNPHIYSGVPYFGGFQSALLYPPNWLHLVLPIDKAVNLGIALHVFLAGFFLYLWTHHRGLHPVACLLSSILFMFSGPFFLHIYAGHLPHLPAMAFAPLLFCAIDGVIRERSTRWYLVGVLALTMQILAGHPQYVFYTAIAAGLYTLFRLIKAPRRASLLVGLGSMYLGAAALTAVQLLAGLQAAGESVRGSGTPYTFAAMLSFAPENFLTLLVPSLFGSMSNYWGRWYLWEMSLFISVTGLVLALYGAVRGSRDMRLFSGSMVLILSVLALGAYTPLFRLLYSFVPGFDAFRANAKFIFLVAMFAVMLAGVGLDDLLNNPRWRRRLSLILGIAGLLVGAVALWIQFSASFGSAGTWGHVMSAIAATQQSYLPSAQYEAQAFISDAGLAAARAVFYCSLTFLLLSVLLWRSHFSPRLVYLVPLIAVLELFVFARSNRPTFDLETTRLPALQEFFEAHPGDYRVLLPPNPNSGMMTGSQDLWGFDPGVLKRYAEFMTFTQGRDPDTATQYLDFPRIHPLFKMLRHRFVLFSEGGKQGLEEIPSTLSRLELIQDWVLLPQRDRIFAAMNHPAFDPRQQIILETTPDPAPVKGKPKGTATITEAGTDYLMVEANLPAPAILLITDNYSSGWRAVALAGSAQEHYDLLPANYILRAVPLSAGNHRLRIEYAPLGYRAGRWISLVSLMFFAGLAAWNWRKDSLLS